MSASAPSDEPSDEILSAYRVNREPLADRPWVTSMMISSLDGSTSVDGLSGGLGNATDRALLRLLRERSDAVLVGAHTARVEGFRPSKFEHLQIVVASRSADEDWTLPLWQSDRTILLTTVDAPTVPNSIRTLRFGQENIDFTSALQALRSTGVQRVVCEGGPRLNGLLLQEDLFDELCLTVAPLLVGGIGPRAAATPVETLRRFTLEHALPWENYMFLNYVHHNRLRSGSNK